MIGWHLIPPWERQGYALWNLSFDEPSRYHIQKNMHRTRIYVDTLPACRRMNPDDGMNSFNFFPSDSESSSPGSFSLSNRRMKGRQALEILLKPRAQWGIQSITPEIVRQIESRVYTIKTDPELHKVSPPVSGPVSTFKDVVLGGWISYVTFFLIRTSEGMDQFLKPYIRVPKL